MHVYARRGSRLQHCWQDCLIWKALSNHLCMLDWHCWMCSYYDLEYLAPLHRPHRLRLRWRSHLSRSQPHGRRICTASIVQHVLTCFLICPQCGYSDRNIQRSSSPCRHRHSRVIGRKRKLALYLRLPDRVVPNCFDWNVHSSQNRYSKVFTSVRSQSSLRKHKTNVSNR